jgi:NAD(P)-dependent dehydrogenase (short-subunit alcohol dehydrogenase family)
VDSFTGKLAVVTGGGSGIGRELVRQLAAQGCSVATCDLNPDSVAVTAATTWAAAPPGTAVTGHVCDVSDEAQVLKFRDELLEQHATDHVDLVFGNAGVAGGASFVKDSRQEWERTFAINWWGVYYCARAFLPLLIASGDGVLIPRLKDAFRDQGFRPAQAATIILDGVRSGAWRILVGAEAEMLDEQQRANPEAPFNYDDYAEMYGPIIERALAEGDASGTA